MNDNQVKQITEAIQDLIDSVDRLSYIQRDIRDNANIAKVVH